MPPTAAAVDHWLDGGRRRSSATAINNRIAIAPAPGSGFRVKPTGGTVILDASAAAYTNINATYADCVFLQGTTWLSAALVNDSSLTTDLTMMTDFFGNAHTRVWDVQFPVMDAIDSGSTTGTRGWFVNVSNSNMPAISTVDNVAVSIKIDNNGSGDFTGGNAANTGRVRLYYEIEATTT